MEIRHSRQDDVGIVEIIGRIDSANSGVLEKQLLQYAAQESSLVLDCAGLDYISSAGLGALLLLLKTMQKKSGRLRLCGLSPRIREIFSIAGFDRIFAIFPSRGEALAAT